MVIILRLGAFNLYSYTV